MRKLLTIMAVVALVGGASFAAQADEYVKGGFEMSGHVNAGAGFQHFGTNAASISATSPAANNNNNGSGVGRGPLGELVSNRGASGFLGIAPNTREDVLIFFVDEAEFDLVKTFGENVRARADFAFGRFASGSGFGAFKLEQAYATANIPVGNGLEFLIGRFDAPIGFESVERGENTLFSHSIIFNALRSQSLTGAKFYYPFSDMVDWHFYIVNNLRDSLGTAGTNATAGNVGAGSDDSVWPSVGTRAGFNWGEEGKKSTIGLSAQIGPELEVAADKTDQWSWLADLDWNVWLTDSFAIGGEGIYRNDNATGAAADGRYFAGQLNLNYVFNDVWDGTLRYAYARQNAGSATALGAGSLIGTGGGTTGVKTQVHEFTLGGQYQIADGAKLQLEYRLDLVKPTGVARGMAHGGALNFAYSF